MSSTATATPINFTDVRLGDTLIFQTSDNGYGGSGGFIEETGTVVDITAKTVVVFTGKVGTTGKARLRSADWYHRSVRREPTTPDQPLPVSTRYQVRKQTSGYSNSESYYVWDKVNKSRVTVHAHCTRAAAQLDANSHNVRDMIRPHAEDPRPYAERLAEAEAAFYAASKATQS